MGRRKRKKEGERVQTQSSMWVWIIVGLIVVGGLFLRLNFVYTASKIPFNFLSDSSQYFTWAKNIISGKESTEVYHQGPLYPFFLALVFSLSSPSILNALVVQAMLGALTCLLIFLLSMRIFKHVWMGIASAFMMAIYAPAIFYNGMLLMATLLIFINLLFLLVLLKAIESRSNLLWALAGLLLGLSALARATILLFIPFLVAFLAGKTVYEYRQGRKKAKEGILSFFTHQCLFPLAFFGIGAILMILPVTVRNYLKGRDCVLIAANAGITFYEGNNPWATGQYMDPPGLDLAEDFNGGRIAGFYEKRHLRPSEISSFWFRESLRFIRENPLSYLKLFFRKCAYFWNRYEIPNAENIYFARQYSKVLRLPLLSFLVVGTLGLLGLIMALYKRIPNAFVLLLFLLSHMAATVLFFITARYRLPIAPILIVFTAYSLFELITEFRDGRYMSTFLWIAIGGLFFVFIAFPWKGLNPRHDYASSYGNIGVLFHLTGNPQKAIRYFEMAIEYDPTYVKSYNNIGGVYYAMGKRLEALRYWQKGLERDPHFPLIHLNLGNMYKNEGQWKKAKEAYAIAAARMPYSIKLKEINGIL